MIKAFYERPVDHSDNNDKYSNLQKSSKSFSFFFLSSASKQAKCYIFETFSVAELELFQITHCQHT